MAQLTRSFSDMLNEYLPDRLLDEKLVKRDYMLTTVEKDDGWKGGTLVVPFVGSKPSTTEFGQMASESDIAEADPVRGQITAYVEVCSTAKFNQVDLDQHDGAIPETTFLRVLPQQFDWLMDDAKTKVSQQLISGPHFSVVTDATNAATGRLIVTSIDRFQNGQKVGLDDDDSVAGTYYVVNVDVNASTVGKGEITLSATRGGAAANVSAYSVAQNAKLYHPGVQANGTFTSLRSVLLTAANGGASTVHGISKLAYPALQAVNVDGSSFSSSNFLDKLFDAMTEVKLKAKGRADTLLMSLRNLGYVMKLLESQKGPFLVTKNADASIYDWTEIELVCVMGRVKIVGIQEIENDIIPMVDWKALKFFSNGGFKKHKTPDGNAYHPVRATTGYSYLVDCKLQGEMRYHIPGHCGIIYAIP